MSSSETLKTHTTPKTAIVEFWQEKNLLFKSEQFSEKRSVYQF